MPGLKNMPVQILTCLKIFNKHKNTVFTRYVKPFIQHKWLLFLAYNLAGENKFRLVVWKAVNFEDSYATGIAGFYSQIEQIKDAQTAEAIPIGSEADVVRVMSIHQSKGLQFPVVYLWSSDSFSMVENKEFCMCDADMGIALNVWIFHSVMYAQHGIV